MIAKKRNLERETESLIIAAQNNTKRINYIKRRIDYIQENSKCKLCADKDETINHISTGKLIIRELYKKLKFDHTYKSKMHKSETVLENEAQKILSNFEIQMDHPIQSKDQT